MRKNDDWKSILNKGNVRTNCSNIYTPKKIKTGVVKNLSVEELLEKYEGATLIKDWDELDQYCKDNPSDTHNFEFDKYSGWLKPKIKSDDEWGHYMSTHTFYGMTYQWSTKTFQECGFNVVIDNWDKGDE